jgi:hypothetical protein
LNVAIICSSLLVMKPLFAKFIPAMVSEHPISAAEDARTWRGTTGLHLLEAGIGGDGVDEKGEGDEGDARRDTAISMGRYGVGVGRKIVVPRRVWDQRRSGRRVQMRWSWPPS